jgi:hypothetical protein
MPDPPLPSEPSQQPLQPPSTTERQQAANRLSIVHLLLWTATTALAVGTIMPNPVDAPFQPDMPAEFCAYLNRQQQQWRVATVVTGPVLGAGLAALAIATWRGWRHELGFPTQPGHWILMIVGMCTVVVMDVRLINRLDSFNSGVVAWPFILIFWVIFLLPVITLAVAYSRVEPIRWKRAFAIAGGSVGLFFFSGCCAFPLFGTSAQLIVLAILYATPISTVVAAALDIRSGRPYDVFHWVGVIVVPVLAVILTGLTLLG